MLDVSPTAALLARALDLCALRQATYSANIANADVEGYRRLEVAFDEQSLVNELSAGNPIDAKDLTAALDDGPQVVTAESAVKLDEEMALMARNALRYQTLLGAYERSMSIVKLAVHEGKEA